MADYENMIFFRCPKCSKVGYAVCSRCGEVDTFKLETDFAACACGQDIDESHCSCGGVVEGTLYFVDEELQKPEKEKIELAEERKNLAVKFNYKKILLLIALLVVGFIIYLGQNTDKDWKYHYAVQTIVKETLRTPDSFKPLQTEVIWRDDAKGDYIVRSEFVWVNRGGKELSGCNIVAIKFKTGKYSWNKSRGIAKCEIGKKLTNVEIKRIIFMNGFQPKA